MEAPGKKVAVLGLGVSGFQSALFLHRKGFDVFGSDQGNAPSLLQRAEELRRHGLQIETGTHTPGRILNSDWVLISPGIAPSCEIYQQILKKKIPLFSEIEVASWFSPSSKIIAVTGSAGKTTVSTLISRVLSKKGKTFLCGNIGNPWIGEIDKIQKDDFIVVEISSFQLVHCFSFRPFVGVLLNLAPNHQDWHPDMEDYVAAKLRMFQNQSCSDVAVIRRTDQECFFSNHAFRGLVQYFDVPADANQNPNERVVRLVANLLGCPNADVDDVLHTFEGIEHRLERVADLHGVSFVNDSKSTTSSSLGWALQKYPDQSVILLAGGHPKSNDFDTVRPLVEKKVKQAILIGEARPLLREAWAGACPFFETNDFRQAVLKARELASQGNTVLLSPACASFDMFKNYLERGQLFKTIVQELVALEESKEKLPSTP